MQNIVFSDNIVADWLKWQANAPKFTKIVVLVDENTEKYCLPRLKGIHFDKIISIESGEKHKNIATLSQIWQTLLDAELDRNSLLLNLGGGVIGDMGGFAAASYKRGIRFIQMPTTLLAMVDASVGGKLGIDFGNIKNSIGVFSAPEHVFIAPEFLATLPDRTLRSGLAEMLKHLAITQPQPIFEIAETPTLADIKASVRIKYDIVCRDPTEQHERKFLNFGHTVGHALESILLETATPLLHGEAVAIGMWVEAKIAEKQGFLSQNAFANLENALNRYFKPLFMPDFRAEWSALLATPLAFDLMRNDKKNADGRVQYIALHGFGQPKMAFLNHNDIKAVL